jgi:hypothetical protein
MTGKQTMKALLFLWFACALLGLDFRDLVASAGWVLQAGLLNAAFNH